MTGEKTAERGASLTGSTASPARPRPFLKWAGGKRHSLPDLLHHLPESFHAYHEPFLGGGALFFALAGDARLRRAYLSDVNGPLMETYLSLRSDLDGVISALRRHKNEEAYYYRIRSLDVRRMKPRTRAARLIYLNRTCYNGLYRENRSGRFNVPFGRYKTPRICDEPNLRAVSRVLQNAVLERRSFITVLEYARRGDLVYFDPPYHPLTATASFTSYHRGGFASDDQIALRDLLNRLDRRGVLVMLSNSDTPFTRGLYAGWNVRQVHAARSINSRADRRGKVAELLVRNYD
ncbi:MAG: DNA adenine methylase [Acidobacteriota bacterium]